MAKKYYGVINGKMGSGIFHGEWAQIQPLINKVSGAKQTKAHEKFDIVKSAFEKEVSQTVYGYYDFNTNAKRFEWQSISNSEVDNLVEQERNYPASDELAILKFCLDEVVFITELNSLLSKYALIALTDEQKEYPIHWAATKGFNDVILKLLRLDQKSINIQDALGETPLHKAVKAGQYKTVELLLKHGAKKSLRKNGAGHELPIELVRDLEPELQKRITDLFSSIQTGYLKVKFEENRISVIKFKKRYKSDSVLDSLRKRQPELCEKSTTASSGFKLIESYEICHKKSDYTIRKEIQEELVGKKYEDVIELLRKKGLKNSDSMDRLEAAKLIFEYYKQISIDPKNLFIDLGDRNGAFGFLSNIAEKCEALQISGSKYFEVSLVFYPHLKRLILLSPFIMLAQDKHYLKVTADNIEIIRELADSHFKVFLELKKASKENEIDQEVEQIQDVSEKRIFTEHYNNLGESTYFKRKRDEEVNSQVNHMDSLSATANKKRC